VLGLIATVSGYALGDLERQDTLAVVAQGAAP
jgi:hypothetical protein